jgi:hypothetical protein
LENIEGGTFDAREGSSPGSENGEKKVFMLMEREGGI